MASSGKRQISSNVNGMLLDAPELFPIYERAAQRGLPMWIHPTTPVMLDLVGTKGNADLLFGWPMDTSLALFRLVIGGVLEKLPQLKVIVHHLGAGTVPYFIERLDGFLPAGEGELPITRPPSYYWKSMSHDTAAVDANAFACGFNVFGADHIVFATDYPYGRNKGACFLEARRRFVDEAQIDAEARQKIYEGNTRQLLHLAGARGILASFRLVAYTALLVETLRTSTLTKRAGLCMTRRALQCRKKR
jgi:uncharacterized protein